MKDIKLHLTDAHWHNFPLSYDQSPTAPVPACSCAMNETDIARDLRTIAARGAGEIFEVNRRDSVEMGRAREGSSERSERADTRPATTPTFEEVLGYIRAHFLLLYRPFNRMIPVYL